MSKRKRGRGRSGGGEEAEAAAPAPSVSVPPPWLKVVERVAPALWGLATAALLWSLMFRFLLNSDLWFHLAAGREIWEGGSIPAVDSWSFTAAGRPWHNHEWLADLAFYGWSRLFGVDSLVVWQWLAEGCAYLLLYRLLARLSANRGAACGLAVLALAVGAPFFDLRPNLWSILGFVVLVFLTLGRARPTPALPLLFAIWVNLHGGVILGLLALPILLAGDLASRKSDGSPFARRLRRPAALWLACILATCLNPWGWKVFSFAFQLAFSPRTPSRSSLYEWLPPWVPGGIEAPLFPLAVVLAMASALLLLRPALRSPRDGAALAGLGLTLLTLAMALQSRRFIPFFAIAQSLLAAQALRRLGTLLRRRRKAKASPSWRGVAAGAALALALLGVAAYRLAPYPLDSRAFDPLSWASQMPVESLNFLEANGIGGKLFAYHLWGGYVEYRAAGRLKVHLDPRAETVFDAATQRQHFQVLEGAPGWQDALARTGADLVLWPMYDERERGMGRELAASGNWLPLYRDGVSLLLARPGASLPGQVRETPDSAYRSWALGRQAMDGRRYADAAAQLERALEQNPRLWPACQSLAIAEVMLHDREAVARTVDRCQDIFPFPYFTIESLLGGRA